MSDSKKATFAYDKLKHHHHHHQYYNNNNNYYYYYQHPTNPITLGGSMITQDNSRLEEV